MKTFTVTVQIAPEFRTALAFEATMVVQNPTRDGAALDVATFYAEQFYAPVRVLSVVEGSILAGAAS